MSPSGELSAFKISVRAEGAARCRLRIWYPSDQVLHRRRRRIPRAILKMWRPYAGRVVLFMHWPSSGPRDRIISLCFFFPTITSAGTTLPAVLAKSGYVVVGPEHQAGLPLTEKFLKRPWNAIDVLDLGAWWCRPIPSVLAKAKEGVSVLQGWENTQNGSISSRDRPAIYRAFAWCRSSRRFCCCVRGLTYRHLVGPGRACSGSRLNLLPVHSGTPKFFHVGRKPSRPMRNLESIGLWQNVATAETRCQLSRWAFRLFARHGPGCDFVSNLPARSNRSRPDSHRALHCPGTRPSGCRWPIFRFHWIPQDR
jgi:hypothetical protein